MSVLLKIDNFGASNKVEKTYLNANAAAAATSVTVKSVQNVVVGRYLLLGKPAQENTELVRITDVTDFVCGINPAASKAHQRYDDVTVLHANKLRVYRAAAPSSGKPALGDYTLLDTVDIDYDNMSTRFSDDGGGVGHYYRYTYFNSQLNEETELEQSDEVRGGSVNDYCSIRDIREEAGIVNNPYISDVYVAGQRTRAQSVINSALKGNYTIPFTAPVPGVVERMTILLAAGYILKREFGNGALGTNADGQAKIDEVLRKDSDNPGLLQQVLNGTLVIVDGDGNTSSGTPQRITGWPNKSTATTPGEDGGGRRKFRASMRF